MTLVQFCRDHDDELYWAVPACVGLVCTVASLAVLARRGGPGAATARAIVWVVLANWVVGFAVLAMRSPLVWIPRAVIGLSGLVAIARCA
jgi:ABC-type iron transport system FetAB permease component